MFVQALNDGGPPRRSAQLAVVEGECREKPLESVPANAQMTWRETLEAHKWSPEREEREIVANVATDASISPNNLPIGEADIAFFDSQETLPVVGSDSSYEELSKDSFDEGDAAQPPDKTLDRLLAWPPEMCHTLEHQARKRKKKALREQRYAPLRLGTPSSREGGDFGNVHSEIGIQCISQKSGREGDGLGVGAVSHKSAYSAEPRVLVDGDVQAEPSTIPHFPATLGEGGLHDMEREYDFGYEPPDDAGYEGINEIVLGPVQVTLDGSHSRLRNVRERRVSFRPPEMSDSEGFSDESDDDSSSGERDLPNLDSIKNRYHDSTWGNLNSTYAPKRIVFQEVAGPSRRWGRMPSFATIFEMFWPLTMLRGIVNETNQYARAPDRNGKLPGRMNWKLLTVQEFKVFLAITLYMGMKRQPNVRSYWYSFPSIFHCPVISKLLS